MANLVARPIIRDETLIEQVNGKDFVVVPYTMRNKDILLIEARHRRQWRHRAIAAFLRCIRRELDPLPLVLKRTPPYSRRWLWASACFFSRGRHPAP